MQIRSHRIHFKKSLLVAGLLLADGLFFDLTNPNRVPSWALIVGFALVSATFYVLLLAMVRMAGFYGITTGTNGKRIARLLGISGGIAIALQSLGELSLRDIVVLLLLTAIAYGYTSYGSNQTKNQQK